MAPTRKRRSATQPQEPSKNEQSPAQKTVDLEAQSQGTEENKSEQETDKESMESTDIVASVKTVTPDEVKSHQEVTEQDAKRNKLETLEREIDNKKRESIFYVAERLYQINKEGLYKIDDENKTWGEYVQERFGIVRSRSYQLINAHLVRNAIETSETIEDTKKELLKTDTLTRPFGTLAKELRELREKEDLDTKQQDRIKELTQQIRDYWEEACRIAKEQDKKGPTERLVKEVVRDSKDNSKDKPTKDNQDIGNLEKERVIKIVKVEGNEQLRGQKGNYGIITDVNEEDNTVNIKTGLGNYYNISKECIEKQNADTKSRKEENINIKAHIENLNTILALQAKHEPKVNRQHYEEDKKLVKQIVEFTSSYGNVKRGELSYKILKAIEEFYSPEPPKDNT